MANASKGLLAIAVLFVLGLITFADGFMTPHLYEKYNVMTEEELRSTLSEDLPPYTTSYIEQNLDHFDFKNDRTFMQRVLISDTYWQPGGPLFVYTGNEGTIEVFYNNSGFVFELAKQHGAATIWIEHRYFGKTLPFGSEQETFTPPNVAWLTVEQALADFAEVITHYKTEVYNTDKAIAFGGSYGGMLSAWLRMKYPNVVSGSLAASAPILQFTGMTDPHVFSNIVTRTFELSKTGCSTTVASAFDQIMKLGTQGAAGLKTLVQEFSLCEPLPTTASDAANSIINWAEQGIEYAAMLDYPYTTDFLQVLPPWPVQVMCNNAMDTTVSPLKAFANAIGVYYNTTGNEKCFNMTQDISGSLGDAAWDVLACGEIIMPIGNYGEPSDFFPAAPWDLQYTTTYCQNKWKITPRPLWIPVEYGVPQAEAHSNIIFSNGHLDPWSGGGVTTSISDALPAIYIQDGAHHVDLRASNPADPASVTAAREQEAKIIAQWLQ